MKRRSFRLRDIPISEDNLNSAVEQFLRSISAIEDDETVWTVARKIDDTPYVTIEKVKHEVS